MEHKMSFRFAEWEGSHSETGRNRQGTRLRASGVVVPGLEPAQY